MKKVATDAMVITRQSRRLAPVRAELQRGRPHSGHGTPEKPTKIVGSQEKAPDALQPWWTTILGFAAHVLFSPWLLLVAAGILLWIKFGPRRSRQ